MWVCVCVCGTKKLKLKCKTCTKFSLTHERAPYQKFKMQSVSAAPSPPASLRKKTEFQVGPWQVGECAKHGCKKLAALSALACDRQSQTETDEERWQRERETREREREVAAWESAVSSLKVKMICIKLVTVTRTLKGPQLQSLGQTYAAPR